MASQDMKPYVKLAATLVTVGGGLLMFERLGLSQWSGSQHHINGLLLSAMVLAPVVLIAAGAVVFMVGKMRRL